MLMVLSLTLATFTEAHRHLRGDHTMLRLYFLFTNFYGVFLVLVFNQYLLEVLTWPSVKTIGVQIDSIEKIVNDGNYRLLGMQSFVGAQDISGDDGGRLVFAGQCALDYNKP